MSVWRQLTHRETSPASVVGRSSSRSGWPPPALPRSARPSRARQPLEELAELWELPDGGRDLFWGVGGKRLAPDPSVTYLVLRSKRAASARATTSSDPTNANGARNSLPKRRRRSWHRGFTGASATISRRTTTWRSGRQRRRQSANPQPPARFREKKPDFHGLDDVGTWSYFQNPFVGTVQLKGLIVLQAMLGNSDLKDDNNALYQLREAFEGAKPVVRIARPRAYLRPDRRLQRSRAVTSRYSRRPRSSKVSSTAV